jgi:hypothetical protein
MRSWIATVMVAGAFVTMAVTMLQCSGCWTPHCKNNYSRRWGHITVLIIITTDTNPFIQKKMRGLKSI